MPLHLRDAGRQVKKNFTACCYYLCEGSIAHSYFLDYCGFLLTFRVWN